MESEKISQNPTVNKKLNSFWSILLIILFWFGSGLLIYQTLKVQPSPEPMIQLSQPNKDPKTDDSLISKGKKSFNQVWHFLGDQARHFPGLK
ncbi:hypothetical protein AM228_08650 [Planktothricoides sp. SR001]|nr:hypothetical protein AM228_08650 [Planktothricoides sp. SR001]